MHPEDTSYTTRIVEKQLDEFQLYHDIIKRHREFTSFNGATPHELSMAFRFFRINALTMNDSDYEPIPHIYNKKLELVFGSIKEERIEKEHFFEHVSELEMSLAELKKEIESINDPMVVGVRADVVRVYISSFQAFLDRCKEKDSDQFPTDIRIGLLSRLKDVNWSSISANANKWANTIIRLIEKLF